MPPLASTIRLTLFVGISATPALAVVNIDNVPVGNINTAADSATGSLYGAVSYAYKIAKNETTISQHAEFLNAVAKTGTYGLYSTSMTTSFINGISRSGTSGSFTYSMNPGRQRVRMERCSHRLVARAARGLLGQLRAQPALLAPQHQRPAERGQRHRVPRRQVLEGNCLAYGQIMTVENPPPCRARFKALSLPPLSRAMDCEIRRSNRKSAGGGRSRKRSPSPGHST